MARIRGRSAGTLGSARALACSDWRPRQSPRFIRIELGTSALGRVSGEGAGNSTRGRVRSPENGLQLNHLRGVNILARANFAEQLFARGVVEIQHGERGTTGLISAE